MALGRLALPIIFAFLLFFQVYAHNKDTNVAGAEDAKFPHGYGRDFPPCPHICGRKCCSAEEFAAFSQAADIYGPVPRFPPYRRPPYCRYYCGVRCCSEEEFAAFSQAADIYGHGPRFPPYRRPPYCHYYCGRTCCSAEEYAEFVQAGN